MRRDHAIGCVLVVCVLYALVRAAGIAWRAVGPTLAGWFSGG